MRINYTMYGTGINGGVRVILEIANKLIERGYKVTITTLGHKGETRWFPLKAQIKYIPRAADYGRRIDLRITKKYLKIKGFEILRNSLFLIEEDNIRLFKEMPECDINVATFCFTTFPVLLSGKGKPFYHMQHHEVLFFNDTYMKKLAALTYYLPFQKIANCVWLKKQIKNIYNEKNLPIVNPAIDHRIFYPRKVIKNKRKMRVISLGRSEPWKGFQDLLKAMEKVMKKEKNIEWIVFGVEKPRYESKKAQYKFIRSPINNQLAELYSLCDIAVSPSWYESFPLPPLEAMACGVPVVTTPYGTEDYAIDKKTALIAEPKNSDSLSKKILELINNPRLRFKLSKQGIEKAEEFTWNNTVNQVEKIFKKISKLS